MRLHFLGANRQVTGSRYLLEAGGLKIMVDCGMFQERKFLERNWQPGPIEPDQIDYLLLTHGHLDHCGLVPRLVAQGFTNPIVAVEPSVRIAEIIMRDAGRIQEEDARYKVKRHRKQNRKGPRRVVPLFTEEDARKAVRLLRGHRYGEPVALNDSVRVTFHEAGHILGSAILQIDVRENGAAKRIVFSGDLGQWGKPLIGDPTLIDRTDHLVLESTYGDRSHKEGGDVEGTLEKVINDTTRRGGNVVIPTFAVERAQELLYHVGRLVHEDRIADLPIYLDSPMAVNVTEIFVQFRHYLDETTREAIDAGRPPLRFSGLKLVRSVEDSKQINKTRGSKIILSASGMCTAGRIKHHLRNNISRPESTILFVGYQAQGTLGRQIVSGRNVVRIHGRHHGVRARIAQVNGLSAHGDRDDLLRWVGHLEAAPANVFLTHGEKDAAESLARAVESKLGGNVSVPHYAQVVDLD